MWSQLAISITCIQVQYVNFWILHSWMLVDTGNLQVSGTLIKTFKSSAFLEADSKGFSNSLHIFLVILFTFLIFFGETSAVPVSFFRLFSSIFVTSPRLQLHFIAYPLLCCCPSSLYQWVCNVANFFGSIWITYEPFQSLIEALSLAAYL